MENNIKNLRIKDPNRLLQVLGIYGIPDVIKMVGSCGFKVFSLSNQQLIDSELERKVSNIKGTIYVENKLFSNTKEILYSDSLSPTTCRFITAYLFSDYQLNCDKNNDYIEILYDESIYDRKVYNYTLDLLMPDKIFSDELEKLNDKSVLAKKYNVSEYLIDEKIKRLQKKKSDLKLL